MAKRKYTLEEAMEIRKNRVRAFLPWSVTLGLGVFLIVLLTNARHLSLPGASTNLFWTAAVSLLAAMVALSPPVSRRLAAKQKKFVWAGSLVAFFIAAGSSGNLQQAYDNSPAGTLAKKGREFEENNRMIAERKQDYADKLQACFGTFNSDEMPKLSEHVKARLHNPDSFEHIETKIALSDVGTTNVRMRFRGENGFSAIRVASVDARIDPEDCSVAFVGEPKVER